MLKKVTWPTLTEDFRRSRNSFKLSMFSKQNELRSHLGCEEVQIIFRNWTIFVFKNPITFELSNKRFHKKKMKWISRQEFFLSNLKELTLKIINYCYFARLLCRILTLKMNVLIPRWIYRKSGISRGIVTPNTGQNATLEIPNFLMAEIFNLNLILLGFYWKTVLVEHWNGTEEAGGKNFLGRGELLGFQRWLAKLARLFSKRYIDLESQFCVAHSYQQNQATGNGTTTSQKFLLLEPSHGM